MSQVVECSGDHPKSCLRASILVALLLFVAVQVMGCLPWDAAPTPPVVETPRRGVSTVRPPPTPTPGFWSPVITPTSAPAWQPTVIPAPPTATRLPKPRPSPLPMPPLANCPHTPLGGFFDVWANDQVWPRLGCAVAPAEAVSGTEAYLCGAVHSIWLREESLFVWVNFPSSEGSVNWGFINDESGIPPNEPLMIEPVPRPQLCFAATGRHAWLSRQPIPAPYWSGAGLATSPGETAFQGAIQQFTFGWLLWNGDVCFVLFEGGTWILF